MPAIYEGGIDESVYVPLGMEAVRDSVWEYGDFQEYPNDPLLASVTFTPPNDSGGGTIRIMSKAQDPYVTNKNNYSNEVFIDNPPITVEAFNIDGLGYVGKRITAATPTVFGGTPPYNILYDFGGGPTQNNWYITQADVGRTITAWSLLWIRSSTDSKQSSNSVGPVRAAINMEPIRVEVNGEIAITPSSSPTRLARRSSLLSRHTSPYFEISASVRQGTAS